MAFARSRFPRRRRNTSWQAFVLADHTAVAVGTTVHTAVLPLSSIATYKAPTLLRIRGVVLLDGDLSPTTTPATANIVMSAMLYVAQSAQTSSNTAGWARENILWADAWGASEEFVDVVGTESNDFTRGSHFQHGKLVVDTMAKRKLDPDQDNIFLSVHCYNGAGMVPVAGAFNTWLRFLISEA
jgi:hypothetical protein